MSLKIIEEYSKTASKLKEERGGLSRFAQRAN